MSIFLTCIALFSQAEANAASPRKTAFEPWLEFLKKNSIRSLDGSRLKVGLAPKTSRCRHLEHTFMAEIASTGESRSRGLSNRTELLQDQAMLFTFDPAQHVSFWMKDTLIALEILFFDAKGELVELYQMPVEANPKYPTRNYASNQPIVAALEVLPKTVKKVPDQTRILCVEPPNSTR
ncbi:MAG: DUF192 domain-containing protein [Bdellovibrionota bacterium]